MPFPKTALLLSGLLTLPLLSIAQTGSSSPRFYVGAGASLLTDRGFRSVTYDNDPLRVGPSLTFGAWLSPRLAVEVSGSVARNNDNFSFTFYDYNSSSPTLITSNIENRQTLYALPVLLRYTLTPVASRFHLDALAGVTVLHSTRHYSQTTTPPGYSSYYPAGSYDDSQTKANVTLGPSLRYSLTSSLHLTADPLVNATLGDGYYDSFRDRLFWNFRLGLHYSFGQR